MAYHTAILHNVYNYYQSNISPKPASRFDAHKRAELKNIYNSIVKLDKESPVYLIDRSVDLEKYCIHMKENAIRFRNTMESLGSSDEESLFSKRTFVSSQPESAEVDYCGSEQINDDFAPISLEVLSMAKPQVNHGDFLPSDGYTMMEGDYSFDITTDDSNYELQFSVSENDTNYDIQSRLARLISGAGIGLNASVATEGNRTALVVSSNSTGSNSEGNALFMISDEETSHTKGMVDYLGIRDITHFPEWTKYLANGVPGESPDQHIALSKDLQVTLKYFPSEPITISTRPDMESLKENITAFQSSYNNFVDAAAEYLHKQPRTSLLLGSMKKMAANFVPQMEALGITQDIQGKLQVSDEALSASLKTGNVDSSLTALRSFAKSSMHKISQVQLNPMDYVDKRMVAYKNPYRGHFANPYTTSAYSGMLFNSYM